MTPNLRTLDLEGCLRRACEALLSWQAGVETHAEDFWSAETGWIKRPTTSWMRGGFPGDWVQSGVHDEDSKVWRYMGVGPIWHTGQTMKALLMARRVVPALAERIDRAVMQGAAYLLRLQIREGRHRGTFWCPPHSLPAEWRGQPMYMMPGKWQIPGDSILNSDMSEAMEGFIMAADHLRDASVTEACRLWGDWLAREANFKPGHYYHWFYGDGSVKELVRFWQPDDGVQGLLAVKFEDKDWLKRYHDGVKRCIEWPIDLKEYPGQQARSFYWNASFMYPVVDSRVPGDRERAVQKFAEYTNWLVGLQQADGMVDFKYRDKGGLEDAYNTSGDGAGTAMLVRMCHTLWKVTGDQRWRDALVPSCRWIATSQMRGAAAAGVEGATPFCRFMKDEGGRAFGFKRSISTIFAVMALSAVVGGLRELS